MILPVWAERLPPDVINISNYFLLDFKLVMAICQMETGGNPYKTRFENNWKYFYGVDDFAKSLGITTDSEMKLQAMSWGFMQVMGSTARECGFNDYLVKLSISLFGLKFGCTYLKKLSLKFSGDDLISAYNAGHPSKVNGRYSNQSYVDGVNHFIKDFSLVET